MYYRSHNQPKPNPNEVRIVTSCLVIFFIGLLCIFIYCKILSYKNSKCAYYQIRSLVFPPEGVSYYGRVRLHEENKQILSNIYDQLTEKYNPSKKPNTKLDQKMREALLSFGIAFKQANFGIGLGLKSIKYDKDFIKRYFEAEYDLYKALGGTSEKRSTIKYLEKIKVSLLNLLPYTLKAINIFKSIPIREKVVEKLFRREIEALNGNVNNVFKRLEENKNAYKKTHTFEMELIECLRILMLNFHIIAPCTERILDIIEQQQ